MGMPDNLVFIRHGNSEANVLQAAAKKGDYSLHTEERVTVPDRKWRLTPVGVTQAQIAGAWVRENLPIFDRFIVSPYVRTRETAGNLALPNAKWEENRTVRERNWGMIGSMPLVKFKERWPESAQIKDSDPLYWQAPSGESIAGLAEGRVRSLANTLHRENEHSNVVVTSHGEFMQAALVFFERWSDEDFSDFENDPNRRIHNCTVLHFTRINPVTGEMARKLKWRRLAYPVMQQDGSWEMLVEPWVEFDRRYYTNEDLLAGIEEYPHQF